MNILTRHLFSNGGCVLLRSLRYSTSKIFSEDLVGDSFYNSEHRAVLDTLTKVIEKEINPYVDEWEAKGEFPAHELFKKLGKLGLLGLTKPIEYGGQGLDYIYSVGFNETLGQIRSDAISSTISIQSDLATQALTRFGSEALKKEFLAPTIAGDFVTAVGVSEPGAGSDVSGILTSAVKKGDDLIINGSKMWITNGVQADWLCLLANTSQDSNVHKNKSLICLPMKSPGIQIAKKIDKLGLRSSDTALIYFEDVRVPQKNIIGEQGMGFVYQMSQFQEERMAVAAACIQRMFSAIQDTIDYCRERETFGQPVLYNQYVHFRLAELATEVELLRALLYQTAKLYAEGKDVTKWASMCKLKTGRLYREVADTCLQYWGGMGFTNEVDISRAYRDGRAVSIVGGSDEMMLMIISKHMNMLPTRVKKQN